MAEFSSFMEQIIKKLSNVQGQGYTASNGITLFLGEDGTVWYFTSDRIPFNNRTIQAARVEFLMKEEEEMVRLYSMKTKNRKTGEEDIIYDHATINVIQEFIEVYANSECDVIISQYTSDANSRNSVS